MLDRLTRLPVTPATRAQIERVHTPAYLDRVERIIAEGGGYLDAGDTVASPGSWAAATAAAGAAIGAVDAVMTGAVDAGSPWSARPATTRRRTGRWASASSTTPPSPPPMRSPNTACRACCWWISTSTTATGPRTAFYNSPQVLYFSTHQSPAYPFTGAFGRDGRGRRRGLHGQRPPAARRRRGGLRAGLRHRPAAPRPPVPAGTGHRLGGLRRPLAQLPLCRGHPGAPDGARLPPCPRVSRRSPTPTAPASWSAFWRAATTWMRWPGAYWAPCASGSATRTWKTPSARRQARPASRTSRRCWSTSGRCMACSP